MIWAHFVSGAATVSLKLKLCAEDEAIMSGCHGKSVPLNRYRLILTNSRLNFTMPSIMLTTAIFF